jgi:hypothetical protein
VEQSLPLLALLIAARAVVAQDTTAASGAPAAAGAPRCNGEVVAVVTIRRQEPVMVERSAGWARPFLRFALAGVPTREAAVAPFLFVRQGQACTERLLAESERVLRAQPFLADARARVIPDGPGSVRVEFATVDDIRAVLGLGVRGRDPTRLKLGSGNVAGYGMAADAQWKQGFAFRDGWSAHFAHYHVFGRPYLFDAVLERAPLGAIASASLSRPLYSDLQRLAWSASIGRVDRYQPFVRDEGEGTLSLDVERRSWALDAAYRLGGRPFGLFAGVQLAGDREEPAEAGVVITNAGFVADPDTSLGDRYGATRRTRVAAMLGGRALSFFKAEGFDALEGAQDVANGVQVATVVGRRMATGPDGWIFGSELYAGAGTPRSFVGLQASLETELAAGRWDDVVAGGRLAWYARPSRRRTRVASFEYSGAWRTTRPFQLLLGTRRAGVRGYDDSRTAGGRRAVMRFEERFIFPGLARYLGFGGAGFIDAGKMWAGDVPFGETVNPRVSAGVGLIVAVPRASRRNLRVDLATPLVSDAGSRWGVNVTVTSGRPRFWREPADLAPARTAARVPVVFGWP